MIRRVRDYIWTLRYLSLRQIAYRLWRPIQVRLPAPRIDSRRIEAAGISLHTDGISITWEKISRTPTAIKPVFLNVERTFVRGIDWSYMGAGLLWNYHLHYLNWLHQPAGIPASLFGEYLQRGYGAGSSLDPYPTSLRIINVVKAFAANSLPVTPRGTALVQNDCTSLLRKIEYHIGANHLLENGFGLLLAGHCLNSPVAWNRGKQIVITQLREQILEDGGHYERSPMYHAILLWRLLDTVNLIEGSSAGPPDSKLVARILRRHAVKMTGWISAYPWDIECGHINDSAPRMSPTKTQLLEYCSRLGIVTQPSKHHESGFRQMDGPDDLKLLIDAAGPSPAYQPGHAHAGTLSFELYQRGMPVLVDTGTSTYERGERREYERSTMAHNTVSIGGLNSSETWAAFRVARRANVTIHREESNEVLACHDGYKSRLGIIHRRAWRILENAVMIEDSIVGRATKDYGCTAHFIFHPDVEMHTIGPDAVTINGLRFNFNRARRIVRRDVSIANGFNRLRGTTAIDVHFKSQLKTTITPIA